MELNTDGTYTYLIVPANYHQLYKTLLVKMSEYGVDMIKDCSSTCKGANKTLMSCWNMFNAACCAYASGETSEATLLFNYIVKQLKIEDAVSIYTNDIYVGEITKSISDFADLTSDELVNNAKLMSIYVTPFTEIKKVTNTCFYILISDEVNLTEFKIKSNSVITDIKANDLFISHSDITINGITYKVYAYHMSDVTTDDPVKYIYTLTKA